LTFFPAPSLPAPNSARNPRPADVCTFGITYLQKLEKLK
jgi:hypothetical protein